MRPRTPWKQPGTPHETLTLVDCQRIRKLQANKAMQSREWRSFRNLNIDQLFTGSTRFKQIVQAPTSCIGCGQCQCRFHDFRCNVCKKMGGIAKVCKLEESKYQHSSCDQVQSQENPASNVDSVLSSNQVHNVQSSGKKIFDVAIHERHLQMEQELDHVVE